MIKLALRGALSDRAADEKIVVIDGWGFDEKPNTKAAAALLSANGVDGKALVVVDREDTAAWLSFRNIPTVHLLAVDQLNTHDILAADYLVFNSQTLVDAGAARGGK